MTTAPAPDSAVAYLTRALEEPPNPDRRGQILLDLGISGTNTYAPLALEHLGEAYELLDLLPGVNPNGPVLVWLADQLRQLRFPTADR